MRKESSSPEGGPKAEITDEAPLPIEEKEDAVELIHWGALKAKSPGEARAFLGSLKKGDKVRVMGEEGDGWEYSGSTVQEKDGTVAEVVLREKDGTIRRIWVNPQRLGSYETRPERGTRAESEGQKRGVIKLSQNENIVQALEGKFAEYQKRIRSGGDPEFLLDANIKVSVLGVLLATKEVNPEILWPLLSKTYGDGAKAKFDNAVAVIAAYNAHQSDRVSKGTGFSTEKE